MSGTAKAFEGAPANADQEQEEGTIGVLVVDDHTMFAEVLARALEDEEGIEVLGTAPSAAEGVDLARLRRPDVVLMDYELPDGTGVAAAATLAEALPSSRVVMVTSYTDDAILVDAIEAGCVGYITKHRAVEEVVAAVRAAARGETLISPSMLARLLPKLRRCYRGLGSDLTPREREVLGLLAEGLPNREIADRLFVSLHTVRNHVQNLITKLHAHSKLQAVATAVREGIIRPPGAEPGPTPSRQRTV